VSARRAGTRPTRRRAAASARTRGHARLAARARRSRLLLVAAFVVAAVVVATSFPFSSLVGQRRQLATVQGQLDRLTAENHSLSSEILRLGDPATVAAIARADYGFVQPGQKAYDILPTAGAPLTSAANSGHVPLEGPPVVPGSAESQTLLDAGAGGGWSPGTTSPLTLTRSGGAGAARASAASPGPPGLWGRVLRTLEFWR